MYKRIITILILLPSLAIGQSILDVDQKTYSLFTQGKWKELIEEGKQAREAGIDFYYLRSRMAISYYNLKNYRKAIPLFQSVYKDYPNVPVIHEYLYWAYIFSGRQKEALQFVGKLTEEDRDKLGVKPRIVSKISVEGGVGNNPGYEDHLDKPINESRSSPVDEMGFEDQTYANLGMEHELSHWLTISHNFTKLNINRYQRFEYSGFPGEIFHHTVNQEQYYLGANISLGNGWQIQPSYHFVWGDVEPTTYSLDNQEFYQYKVSYSSGIGFIGITREIANFSLSIGGLAGKLDDENISQVNAGLIYYPMGNTDLYFGSDLYYQSREALPDNESTFIFNGKVGGRVGKLWLEGNATLGELVNFVENDNQTIWNSVFPTKKKLGGGIYVPLAKYKFVVSLRYTYLDMEGSKTDYVDSGSINSTFQFKNHLFTGGITWNL